MNEIEAIYCKVLGCDRSSLYLNRLHQFLSGRQDRQVRDILKKRIKGEPLQYLLGDTDFMGLRLRVKRGVLIPRPETEILVEQAVEQIRALGVVCPEVLDMGTGSGNIAISVAKFIKDAHVTAVDISKTALALAKSNARALGVFSSITFRRSHLFDCFRKKTVLFDFIISNPPYVAPKDFDGLPADVRREPKTALLAKDEGTYFYAQIEKGASQYLKKGGMIFLEVGARQASKIKDIFSDKRIWSEPIFIKDYHDIDRVAIIKKR